MDWETIKTILYHEKVIEFEDGCFFFRLKTGGRMSEKAFLKMYKKYGDLVFEDIQGDEEVIRRVKPLLKRLNGGR